MFEDLQPYVCTFDDCDLPDHFFASRDEWFRHETHQHRVKWSCNTDHHPEYDTQTDFLLHIETCHHKEIDVKNFEILRDVFRQPSRDVDGVCNLCMRYSKNLKTRVSRHLEEMALSALPRANDAVRSGYAGQATNASMPKRTKESKGNNHPDDEGEEMSSSRSNEHGFEGLQILEDNSLEDLHLEDDYELVAELAAIPETTEQHWDDVMEKFSRARARSYRPLNVLVRGESEVSKILLRTLLEKMRCRVYEALEGTTFDIVIVACLSTQESPSSAITGRDVTTYIRNSESINPNTPVIVLTRPDARQSLSDDLERMGTAAALLDMPPTKSQLEEVLGRLCQWEPHSPEPSPETDIRMTEPGNEKSYSTDVGDQEAQEWENEPGQAHDNELQGDMNQDAVDARFIEEWTAGAQWWENAEIHRQLLLTKQIEILGNFVQDEGDSATNDISAVIVTVRERLESAQQAIQDWEMFRDALDSTWSSICGYSWRKVPEWVSSTPP